MTTFYRIGPRITPISEIRGYFMRHKTGGDIGFSWDKDDPQFSSDWERIPAVAATPPDEIDTPELRRLVNAYRDACEMVRGHAVPQWRDLIAHLATKDPE